MLSHAGLTSMLPTAEQHALSVFLGTRLPWRANRADSDFVLSLVRPRLLRPRLHVTLNLCLIVWGRDRAELLLVLVHCRLEDVVQLGVGADVRGLVALFVFVDAVLDFRERVQLLQQHRLDSKSPWSPLARRRPLRARTRNL